MLLEAMNPIILSGGSSGVAIANNFINDSLCAGNYSVTITDNNNNLVAFFFTHY